MLTRQYTYEPGDWRPSWGLTAGHCSRTPTLTLLDNETNVTNFTLIGEAIDLKEEKRSCPFLYPRPYEVFREAVLMTDPDGSYGRDLISSRAGVRCLCIAKH